MLFRSHREFIRAGSDVVQAFTYYGHREKLRIIGKEHLLEPMQKGALKIAKDADEPTGNLDEENSTKVTNAFEILLSRYNSTIVIATHSKKLAQNLNVKLIIKNKKINKI